MGWTEPLVELGEVPPLIDRLPMLRRDLTANAVKAPWPIYQPR